MAYIWMSKRDEQTGVRVDSSINGVFTMLIEEIKLQNVPPGAAGHVMVGGVSIFRTFFRTSDEPQGIDGVFMKCRRFCEVAVESICTLAMAPAVADGLSGAAQVIERLADPAHIEAATKAWDGIREAITKVEMATQETREAIEQTKRAQQPQEPKVAPDAPKPAEGGVIQMP